MCYIGMTSQTLEERARKDGKGYKRKNGGKFWDAIQKFGWNEFNVEILEDGITDRKVANETELKYIKKFDSVNNGYNETDMSNNTSSAKNKTWKWNISKERKEELKINKSKKIICGCKIYNTIDELSLEIGISKHTIYGWLSRQTEFINANAQRDYYLKDLNLKYYDEEISNEESENQILLKNNKILTNDIKIQEKRIIINKNLIHIYGQLDELSLLESRDNTVTNNQISNYIYLKNIIESILKI